jgi:membrane protein CcdC involved in cytochrome C biogenesis
MIWITGITIIISDGMNMLYVSYVEQIEGLAMGVPTSAILAETSIQHMEHKYIYLSLKTQHIIAYYRNVEDILIICI